MKSEMTMRTQRGAQAGFTIIEIMVGVVVGLIATVVMFQVFAVSENQKRTTTGAGDAQQSGVFSLFQIERDARMAGYGINYTPLLGCKVNGWHEPSGTGFELILAPVVIENGAGNASDKIIFMYGDSDLFQAPAKLTQSMPNPSATYKVDNRFGFKEGDLVIAAENGKPCTLAQASGIPGTPGNSDNVIHNSGNYTNAEGQNVPTEYNRPGGLPPPNNISYGSWNPATGTGGRLYNLGAAPTRVTYTTNAKHQLTLANGLIPNEVDEISDGIVHIQAQYGYDLNGDGRITNPSNVVTISAGAGQDQWADSMMANPTSADWARVIAVRIVVVARSQNAEKPEPAPVGCNATQNLPRWIAKGVDLDISGTDPEWKCYRYRTFELTVPIRNMIWLPQAT